MSLNCLKRLNHGKKLALSGLKLVKVCLHLQKKTESRNWFMGVAAWRNLHNTTKPVILNALTIQKKM
jgi:hypothetical protein